jgi:hypothetical protein
MSALTATLDVFAECPLPAVPSPVDRAIRGARENHRGHLVDI